MTTLWMAVPSLMVCGLFHWAGVPDVVAVLGSLGVYGLLVRSFTKEVR